MDNNTEVLGIAFCNAMAKNTVTISPGLGALINGSTKKISMRRKAYNELRQVSVEGYPGRIVRKNNKTIVLFSAEASGVPTEFEIASAVLKKIGQRTREGDTPLKISVDAMTVGHFTGETKDYEGALLASRHHELVVYEDRGQSLSYLQSQSPSQGAPPVPTDCWDHPVLDPDISGSQRLQERVQREKDMAMQQASARGKEKNTKSPVLAALGKIFGAIPETVTSKIKNIRRTLSLEKAVEEFVTPSRRLKSEPPTTAPRTRADMGQVKPPEFKPVQNPRDHMVNAFIEFLAVTKATHKVNTENCKTIMQTYHRDNRALLEIQLGEAEAAIYDNDKAQVLAGSMSGSYMVAYSATNGFVASDEDRSKAEGKARFNTPPNDPIVVVAKCTKVMLDDRILGKAQLLSGDLSGSGYPQNWVTPSITWVNGVPGCGKSTWMLSQMDPEKDVITTTTTEGAEDLRKKLEPRIGEDQAKKRVRTMASLLVNGLHKGISCKRLMVDEALMSHFGSIVMAAQLARASEVILLGDYNQLPYIDRCNLFPLLYNRPNLVTNISKELLCTYRNPQDVAYALREIYSGIYSAKPIIKSLSLKRYKGSVIPREDGILYLVHTQAEKASLISQGYGTQKDSRTLTIHEAQGLTYETVVLVRTNSRKSHLIESVPHAVVAVSRHTKTCVYYTDSIKDDAIARLILNAEAATEARIRDYNLKMAIRNGDHKITSQMMDAMRRPGEAHQSPS